MFSRLICSLFCSFLAFGQQTRPGLSASDLYKMASPSVVLIESYGEDGKVSATGSGFIIASDGLILTNFHVIAHTKKATIRLSNDDAYDYVGVLDVDKRKDIALIKIKAVNLPRLKLGRSSAAQIGDKVYALGNPLGVFQNTLSEGIISGIRQADGYRLFQLTTPISHGSSGGPVFNTDGEVVGIVNLTVEEGQNLNFAIPIDYAAGMLDSKEVRSLASVYEPESTAEPVKQSPKMEQTLAAVPSENLKRDAITYLSDKVGKWTKEEAEKEFGQPIDRRDGFVGASIVGDIYKYSSPAPGFGTIELNFDRTKKYMVAAYFYYDHVVPWSTVRGMLGHKYKRIKMPNGRPAYLYQFQQRQVCAIVDSADNIVNIGVW